MSLADIEVTLEHWAEIEDLHSEMAGLVEERLAAFDDEQEKGRSPYEIIAASFLFDILIEASLISMPSLRPPEIPQLVVCTGNPGVSDSAMTNAVPRVDGTETHAYPATQTFRLLRANPGRNVPLPQEEPISGGANSTADTTSTSGTFDPTTLRFKRPPSHAGTRRHAIDKLRTEANTRNAVSIEQQNEQRRKDIINLLNNAGKRTSTRKKLDDLPDNTCYVTNAAGCIVGSFKRAPPTRLAHIMGGSLRSPESQVTEMVSPGSNSPTAKNMSIDEVRTEARNMIWTQLEDDSQTIAQTLSTFKRGTANVMSLLVPSKGITIKTGSTVKKGPVDERIKNAIRPR